MGCFTLSFSGLFFRSHRIKYRPTKGTIAQVSIDLNYLYALLSFAVGLLSGLQSVYSRYPTDSFSAAMTLPGGSYLLTRGALPGIAFAVLYGSGTIQSRLFLFALGIGVGWESILRSQFLLKQSPKPGGGIDELVKGPLDLLRWYQDLFLTSIDTKKARKSLQFVKKNLPAGDFKALCTKVRDQAAVFQNPPAGLQEAISKLVAEFDADSSEPTAKNERYRLRLGFVVLQKAGKENFQTLFS